MRASGTKETKARTSGAPEATALVDLQERGRLSLGAVLG
jgi:hypothetical protein